MLMRKILALIVLAVLSLPSCGGSGNPVAPPIPPQNSIRLVSGPSTVTVSAGSLPRSTARFEFQVESIRSISAGVFTGSDFTGGAFSVFFGQSTGMDTYCALGTALMPALGAGGIGRVVVETQLHVRSGCTVTLPFTTTNINAGFGEGGTTFYRTDLPVTVTWVR